MSMINKPAEDDAEYWKFDEILLHRTRNKTIEVLVKWTHDTAEYEPTSEPMSVIKLDDPITLARYARDNGLLDQLRWKWARRYVKNELKYQRMVNQVRLMKKRTNRAIKFQFGYQVLRNIKECKKLDKEAGNTEWMDSVNKEVTLLRDTLGCFREAEAGEHRTSSSRYYGYLQSSMMEGSAVALLQVDT